MKKIVTVLAASLSLAFGDAHYFAVKEGNEQYNAGDYDDAIDLYSRAQKEKDSAVSKYNLGNARFRKGEYEKAAELYSAVLDSPSGELAEKGLLNFANTKMKSGFEKLEKSAQETVALEDLKAAEGAYRKILLDDPSNMAAKENMELAMIKIEELEKQSPQKKSDKEEKKKKDKDDGKPESGKDQKDAPDQNEKQREQKEQKAQEKNQKKSDEKSDAAKEGQKRKMTPEDVKRILDALERNEKKVIQQLHNAKMREKQVEKDW
ncbi:MAG: BatC protein [bacterium]|nr:MAG: BatC protein [bacterium]